MRVKCALEGCSNEFVPRMYGPWPRRFCCVEHSRKFHRAKELPLRRERYRKNPELTRLNELKYRLTTKGQKTIRERQQREKMMRQFNGKIRLAIRIVLKEVSGASDEGLTALRFLRQHIDGLIASFEAQMGATEKKRPYTESPWVAEKREARKEAAEFAVSLVPRDATKEQRLKAATMALSLYDTIKVLGRSAGDIRYSEFGALKKQGAFAAAFVKRLERHGIPNTDMCVREYISLKDLAKDYETALCDAEKQMKAA